MQALARLSMSREEQRQGDQAQAASTTGGEVGNPGSPSQVLLSADQGEGVVPVEVGPRADRFGTTPSPSAALGRIWDGDAVVLCI